jgi:hypothetical protein
MGILFGLMIGDSIPAISRKPVVEQYFHTGLMILPGFILRSSNFVEYGFQMWQDSESRPSRAQA